MKCFANLKEPWKGLFVVSPIIIAVMFGIGLFQNGFVTILLAVSACLATPFTGILAEVN